MEDDLLAFGNLAAVYHCDRRLGSLGGDAVDKTQHPYETVAVGSQPSSVYDYGMSSIWSDSLIMFA